MSGYLKYFDSELPTPYRGPRSATRHTLLLENRTLEVWSIRCATVPFLWIPFPARIAAMNIEVLGIAKYGLSVAQITAAKRGGDLQLATGEVILTPALTYRPYAALMRYLFRTRISRPRPQDCLGSRPDVPQATTPPPPNSRRAKTGDDRPPRTPQKRPLKADKRLVIGHYSSRVTRTMRRWSSKKRGRSSRELSGSQRNHLHHRKTTMTKAEIQLVRALADKRGPHEYRLLSPKGKTHRRTADIRTCAYRKIFAMEGGFRRPGEWKSSPRAKWRRLLVAAKPPTTRWHWSNAACPTTRRPTQLKGRLTLALDDVQNPGNLGTIIQLADWFGITDIVCSKPR